MKVLVLANSKDQSQSLTKRGEIEADLHEIQSIFSQEELNQILQHSSYEAVFLYYPLRWTDNLAALHQILTRTKDIPVVLIGESRQVEVLGPIVSHNRCHFVEIESIGSAFEILQNKTHHPIDVSGKRQSNNSSPKREPKSFQLLMEGYRVLFEQAEEAILILNDGIFVDCNKKTEVLFKAPRDKLVGCSLFDLSPPRQPDGCPSDEKAMDLIATVLEGTPQYFEWLHRRPDGTTFDAEVSLKAIECEAGNVLEAIVRDVTDQKKARLTIQELSQCSEENPSPIIRVTIQGQIVYANKPGSDILSRLKAKVGGNLPSQWMEKLYSVVQQEDFTPVEYKVGDTFYSFNFSKRPQQGYVTLYGFDTTEARRSHQALEEANQRYRTFVRTSFDGIFSIEMEHPLDIHLPPEEVSSLVRKYAYISEANDATARMVGLEEARSFIGVRLKDILKQGANNAQGAMEQFIQSRFRLSESELKWTGFDGQTRLLQLNLIGIFDKEYFYRAWGTLRDVTEQHRNEQALRESEEKFRALTELASAITFIYQNNQIKYLNSTAEKLIGWSRDEVIGRDIWEFVMPEYQDLVKERVAARQRGEEVPARYELELQSKEKKGIWVEVNLNPIELHGERAVLGTAFNITERKRAEYIQSAIFQISEVAHTKQTMDEAYAEIHEIIQELMPAKNFYIALYDEEAEEITFPYFVDQYTQKPFPRKAGNGITEYVVRTGKPLLVNHESLAEFQKQGEIEPRGHMPVDWLGIPLRTNEKTIGILAVQSYDPGVRYTENEKNILNFVSMQVAMTIERKQAESNLAREQQQLAVTLHSIGDGVLTTDTSGRIVMVNRVAENLIGRSEKDIQGEFLTEVFSKNSNEDKEMFNSIVRKVVESKQIYTLPPQTVIKTETESRRIIAHSIAPLLDEEGEAFGTVMVFEDETEKHNMEMELLKSRKLESVGTLAGGIAHDFNNILAGVLGYVSLIRLSQSDPEKVETLIQKTERSVQRASNLTNQLLTFSKGGAPVKETASIAEVIEESVQFALHGANVNCTLDIPEDLWLVDMDTGQIDQVIQNVIINANQAMPMGGTILVAVKNLVMKNQHKKLPLKGGNYVQIEVTDEGHGIPKENIDKIFDPYFTTKDMGSGLGLATAYSIIDKHGGYIKAESKVGRGTTITIYLPATGHRESQPISGISDVTPEEGRVLVMDDEETVLDVAAEMLRSLGYEVDIAHDGEEVLKKYKSAARSRKPYAFTIIDLTVPGGKGGVEAVRDLQRYDPLARVIVSSGYSNDPVMAQYADYGFGAKVAKPYNLEKLRNAIRQIHNKDLAPE